MVHSICLIMMVGIGPIQLLNLIRCYFVIIYWVECPLKKSLVLFNLPKFLTMDSS